jgi:hypothetical protein
MPRRIRATGIVESFGDAAHPARFHDPTPKTQNTTIAKKRFHRLLGVFIEFSIQRSCRTPGKNEKTDFNAKYTTKQPK